MRMYLFFSFGRYKTGAWAAIVAFHLTSFQLS